MKVKQQPESVIKKKEALTETLRGRFSTADLNLYAPYLEEFGMSEFVRKACSAYHTQRQLDDKLSESQKNWTNYFQTTELDALRRVFLNLIVESPDRESLIKAFRELASAGFLRS